MTYRIVTYLIFANIMGHAVDEPVAFNTFTTSTYSRQAPSQYRQKTCYLLGVP